MQHSRVHPLPVPARALVRAVLGIVLAAILAACTEDAPLQPLIDDTVAPPNTVPPADASPPYDVAACTSCIAHRCVAEQVRCFREPGCVTIANCAHSINCDEACINKCVFNQTGLGRREYQALTTCEFEASCGACSDACDRSAVCPLRSPPSTAPAVDAAAVPVTCTDCTHARCGDAIAKCEPGTACANYYACANPCLEPRQKCVDDCGVKFPQGKADGDAVGECTTTVCKAQCVY